MTGRSPASVTANEAADKTWRVNANTSKSVHKTESRGGVLSTPTLCIGDPGFASRPGHRLS